METRFSKIDQEMFSISYLYVEKPKFIWHQGRKQVEGFYKVCFYWIYKIGEWIHNKTILGESFNFAVK